MRELAKLTSFCAAAMASGVACAADCDQGDSPPQHQGTGPVFSSASGVVQSIGGEHVKQRFCYFPPTERLLSIEPTLRDAKGRLSTYAVYDVTHNYERAGFTLIKVSWTTTAKKPIPADQLTFDFKAAFEAPQTSAQP